MPKRRKSYNKKKKWNKSSKMIIPRSIPLGFPEKMTVKLRYNTDNYIPIGGAAGVASYYVYRANSVFDPDYTGFGIQPTYFDTFAAIYRSYTVLGSKITVNYVAPTDNVYLGIFLDPILNRVENDPNVISSNKNSIWKVYNAGAGSNQTCKLSKSYSAKHFTCRGQNPLTDENQQCSVTTNPNNTPGFYVYAAPTNSGVTMTAVNFIATIEYVVTFSDLNMFADT